MGKLAGRLADPLRSGLYRVEATEALEEAAALNGFLLERCDGAPGALEAGDGRVLLFSDPALLGALRGALEAAAAQCRERGLRYFAVFLDPGAHLSLPPLYNWQRRREGG